MSSSGWRTTALVLGALCLWQQWRACHRPSPPRASAADCAEAARTTAQRTRSESSWDPDRVRDGDEAPAEEAAPAIDQGIGMHGFRVPSWTRSLLPQPGEDLRAYRDRMVPLAQLAVSPHRARVSRSSADFAAAAGLDDGQRAELETAAKETATAIQDRLFNAVLSGEISPSTFKPMAGVAVARDVLDLVDQANQRFVGSLREDQRGKLAQHPFDFADYLVFSTKWEDAISGL